MSAKRFTVAITHARRQAQRRSVDLPWLEMEYHIDKSDWMVLSEDGWRAVADGHPTVWNALERKLLVGFQVSQPQLIVVIGRPAGSNAPDATAQRQAEVRRIAERSQELILKLNGGLTHTELGSWLASTMPNYFGASGYNLSGATNASVGALFQKLFKLKGQKLDASVMSVALSVYVTNSSLAGTVAAPYGFLVSTTGVGNSVQNVETSGAAFGVTNGSAQRVLDLLRATDARTANGSFYGGDDSLRKLAYSTFSGLLEAGALTQARWTSKT